MRLALAMGDPAGIGPEIVVRAALSEKVRERCEVVLFGDVQTYERAAHICGLPCKVSDLAGNGRGLARFVDNSFEREPKWGRHSGWAGQVQIASLLDALDAAAAKDVDGVVFAPFNKHSLQLAGVQGDEAVVLRDFFDVPEVRTVTRWGELMRATVVGHVPFARISEKLTPDGIASALGRLERMCLRYGMTRPRIGVSGLNPHAGDGGTLGSEESTMIAPVLRNYAKTSQAVILGPYSPDILMPAALRGDLDGLVYLYHDQGNIALKAVSFGREVVFYPDLPIAVATVAHGTAHDIAGCGQADPGNFIEAVLQTAGLAERLRDFGKS